MLWVKSLTVILTLIRWTMPLPRWWQTRKWSVPSQMETLSALCLTVTTVPIFWTEIQYNSSHVYLALMRQRNTEIVIVVCPLCNMIWAWDYITVIWLLKTSYCERSYFRKVLLYNTMIMNSLFFHLWVSAAWKLSPMVGTVYGPELYAGKTAQYPLLNAEQNIHKMWLYFVYIYLGLLIRLCFLLFF